MAESRWDEKLITRLEESPEGQKHGQGARKYAVDCWYIHIGEWEAPKGWKDPYAKLDKAAKAKSKAKSKK